MNRHRIEFAGIAMLDLFAYPFIEDLGPGRLCNANAEKWFCSLPYGHAGLHMAVPLPYTRTTEGSHQVLSAWVNLADVHVHATKRAYDLELLMQFDGYTTCRGNSLSLWQLSRVPRAAGMAMRWNAAVMWWRKTVFHPSVVADLAADSSEWLSYGPIDIVEIDERNCKDW